MPHVFPSGTTGGGRFPTTHGSVVLGAGSEDPGERARSFELLVRAYWKPVYKHVRVRWRKQPADARDLTQGFFARSFEKRWFGSYEPSRARFRTYLKTCLDRFVMEGSRDERREKRGGGAVHLSLDFDEAEREMRAMTQGDQADAEACFDREWIRHLFADVVATLERSCAEAGREVTFRIFRSYVLDDDDRDKPSYASLAAELGLKVTDVTNHLAWGRREFRRVALERLRELTASDEEFCSEARAVFGIDP